MLTAPKQVCTQVLEIVLNPFLCLKDSVVLLTTGNCISAMVDIDQEAVALQ